MYATPHFQKSQSLVDDVVGSVECPEGRLVLSYPLLKANGVLMVRVIGVLQRQKGTGIYEEPRVPFFP